MQVTDPVCGTKLELDEIAGHQDYRGWAYFFCSVRCHERFKASPERYSERVWNSRGSTGSVAKVEGDRHG